MSKHTTTLDTAIEEIPLNEKIEKQLFIALGEASALFMSQPIKGTKIIMPTEDLEHIGKQAYQTITTYLQQEISASLREAKCSHGHPMQERKPTA